MGVLSGDLVGVLFCQQFQLLHQTGIVGVDPVSYTHLDVYKRQPVLRLSGLGPFRHDVQRAIPLLEEDDVRYHLGTGILFERVIRPVSYTHLSFGQFNLQISPVLIG